MIFVTNNLSRCGSLRTGPASGGGLLLSLALSMTGSGDDTPTAFIRIGNDGEVVLTMPCGKTGLDTDSAIALLIAEELEVDRSQISLERATDNPSRAGVRRIGGPTATTAFRTQMRHVAAIARAMLVIAAAQRWDVDATSCNARNGEVIHAATGRRIGYGALASYAGRLPAPAIVALKQTDAPARFDGAAIKNAGKGLAA